MEWGLKPGLGTSIPEHMPNSSALRNSWIKLTSSGIYMCLCSQEVIKHSLENTIVFEYILYLGAWGVSVSQIVTIYFYRT